MKKRKISDNYKAVRRKSKIGIDDIFVLIVVALIFYGIGHYYNKSRNFDLVDNNLVEVELTLEKKPEIKRGKNPSLQIQSKEWPNFTFQVFSEAYKVLKKQELMADTEGGDKIYLIVDKETYQQRLTKEKPLSFWNKYFDRSSIPIYSVRTSRSVYLSKENFINASRSGYRLMSFVLFIMFLLMIYLTRHEIIRYANQRGW